MGSMRWGSVRWLRALLLAMGVSAGLFAAPAAALAQETVVRELARQVMASADHQGLPFAIVDKRGATLNIFDAEGRPLGSTPALLGLAPGDYYVPGVASRVKTGLSAYERTTPAGRYVSEPGRNLNGEQVVWVDYATAFAIHRMRPSAPRERRDERLASRTPDDNRITLGCVVVSVPFYERVVQPVLGQGRAVVYVLPESGSISELMAQSTH